jgi:geranylgeranyl pyrophosphate synthase
LTIASIYEPIQEDLIKVEESIKAFCRAEDYPWMSQPLTYVLEGGGKRIRPAVVLLAAKFYHYDLEKLIPMATGVEVFHNATLVHDDSIDKSSIRRGKPTVNIAWGDETALLLGDYLFAGSGDLVSSARNHRVTRLFSQTIMKICSGQLKELTSAYDCRRSQQDYYEQIESKTAALFATAAEAGAILSEAPEEAVEALRNYGRGLGMAFQIIDDILDYIGDEKKMGKPVGGDLFQGTVTLPAILFIENHPGDNPLEEVFEKKGDRAEVQRFIDMVRKSTAVQQCYSIAAGFTAKASQALEQLPENAARRSLSDLAYYVVERHK